MMLNEGGNVFPDVVPFDHAKINDILNKVNSVLRSTGAKAIPIGSTATPAPGKKSGDMDLIVDQDALASHFDVEDPKQIRKALRALFDQAGLQTGQSGISVHARIPTEDAAHQVDIMVVPNAENAAKFHTHTIPQGSPFKGKNKQIAMAYLAKKNNMLWSPYQGLFGRDSAGKKGEFITHDIDEVAKHLLGPNATAKDLGSLETMMDALPPEEAQQMLTDLRADKAWSELPKQESLADKQLARISELMQKMGER